MSKYLECQRFFGVVNDVFINNNQSIAEQCAVWQRPVKYEQLHTDWIDTPVSGTDLYCNGMDWLYMAINTDNIPEALDIPTFLRQGVARNIV